MVHVGARVSALLALLVIAVPAAAQVAGENVNMVSGTQWPGGDPFLQRQNEPTMAVSSVNPQHLMAGANDYRSVDVPDPAFGKMAAGDAWLGVFKSLDGGQTWRSVLLPGYPQDRSADGLASPLKTTMVVPKTFNGSPQEVVQIGKAVTLPGSADPVMRAGTDGMFYYLGINFARDKSVSRLFVGRFIDLNNKENGDATAKQPGTGNLGSDPIKYLDTQILARSTDLALNGGKQIFIDKPWMAVDVPRAGAGTCTVPDGMGGTRKILAGAIYVGWAQFAPGDVSSDIMLTSSGDCGVHWAPPRKLNTVNSVLNQGVAIGIEPLGGRVVVAWRRVASGKQADAIMATRANARRKAFAAPRVVAKIVPFDLGGTFGQARTQTMPSMAISSDGAQSWVHLAWASRDGAGGPSRVWMTTARILTPPTGDQDSDEADSSEQETRVKWSAPAKVSIGTAAAPPSAAQDDAGHTLTRGHQFMPALTASQGKVVLFYYDTRLDHTRRLYTPNAPTAGRWAPDPRGKFYQEELAPLGDLSGSPDGAQAMVFSGGAQAADLEDASMRLTRHTIDATVGFAAAGPSPQFSGQLVSRFPFGATGAESTYPSIAGFKDAAGLTADPLGLAVATADPKADAAAPTTYTVQRLQQLQFNPPGLPMFKGGTTAFMGDYIDVQGQNFVAGPSGWRFNSAPSRAPVFHAVWTSNQDVRAPVDSTGAQHWDLYTPVTLWLAPNRPAGGAGVLFDGGRSTPNVSNQAVAVCEPGSTGSRDQNIYTSRITEGLQVSTPQNAKVLVSGAPTGFVIAAANSTAKAMTVRFGAPVFAAGYAGGYRTGYASDFTVPTVDAVVAPFSSVHRTLFVQQGPSPDAAPVISVTVEEVGACGTACRSGSLTFNPPIALSTLVMPDGVATAPGSGEIYTATIGAPNVSNPNVSNPNVSNPNVSNPNVSNPNVSNPNVSNPNVSNPNVSNVTISSPNVSNPNVSNPNVSNPNVSNPNVSNPNVSNPNVSNPNVSNPNVSNMAVSDASYTITNQGNTTASYHVKVVGDARLAPSPLQLIVSKTYKTPVAIGCDLKEVAHDQVVVSVPDISGAIAKPTDTVSTGVTDPNVSNATVALAPGESAVVTLRGFVPPTRMAQVAAALTPVPVPAKVPPSDTSTKYTDLKTDTGQPLLKTATTTRLTTLNGVYLATVSPGAGPTGMVSFLAGTQVLAVVPLVGGAAAFTPATPLGIGETMVALYSGDAAWAASTGSVTTLAAAPLTVTGFLQDYLATFVVSQGGAPYDGATVTYNGVNVPLTSAGRYVLSAFPNLPAVGQPLTVTVTGGGLTVTGAATMPERTTITSPVLGSDIPLLGPLTVTWTTPTDPEYFALDGFCGSVQCTPGVWATPPGLARSATLPAAFFTAGAVDMAIYAHHRFPLTGDATADSNFLVQTRDPFNVWWSFTATAPAGWTTLASTMAFPRFHHGVGQYNGQLFVAGGMPSFSPTAPVARSEFYDLTSTTWAQFTDLPISGYYQAQAQVGSSLYLLGGHPTTTLNDAVATGEVFDLATLTFASVPPMNTARGLPAAAPLGAALVVSGGYANPTALAQASVEAFDGTTWSPLPPMLTERFGHQALVVGNQYFAVGGRNSAIIPDVEVYDATTGTWSPVAPLPVPLYAAAGAVVNGKLYVMGGVTTGEQVRPEVYVFDPVANIWSSGPALTVGVSRAAATVVNGTIFLTGGFGPGGAQGIIQAYTP